jgi:hypothetical protein
MYTHTSGGLYGVPTRRRYRAKSSGAPSTRCKRGQNIPLYGVKGSHSGTYFEQYRSFKFSKMISDDLGDVEGQHGLLLSDNPLAVLEPGVGTLGTLYSPTEAAIPKNDRLARKMKQ